MYDSIPISRTCNPQVLHRDDGQFFIRDPESGHIFPASRAHLARRFGELFAQSVEQESGVWITFDNDTRADMERITANRIRYSPVGTLTRDFLGHPLYSLWDHAKGKLVDFVFETFESALLHIDGIDGVTSTWPATRHADGTWSVDPVGGLIAGEMIRILQDRGETVRKHHRPSIPELKPITIGVQKLDPAKWPEVLVLEGGDTSIQSRQIA